MKHFKKKYAIYLKKLPIKENALVSYVYRRGNDALKAVDKNEKLAFMKDTDGYHTLSIIYDNQGKQLTVPIPDLTLVYYDSAYMNNVQRKGFKNDLFENLSQTSEITEDVSHELYRYINYATTSIIMMFTAIESFMNKIIPDNGEYQKSENKIYTKTEIERYSSFEDKILKVIPFFRKKYFKDKDELKESLIGKLKNLRDKIIHTKSSILYQKESALFKELLNFEYDKTLLETKDYMNFYKLNYIEDCPCNQIF